MPLPDTALEGTLSYQAIYRGRVGPGEQPFAGLSAAQRNDRTLLPAAVSYIVQGRPVYRNDFEHWAGPEWSNTVTEQGRGSTGDVLGVFGSQTITLTLTELPAHTLITGTVDLYLKDTWDGNWAIFGPDIWELRAGDGPPLVRASFTNWVGTDLLQSYPAAYGAGENPAGTGAMETSLNPLYSLYHIPFTLTHDLETLTLHFTGVGLQDRTDESWGIDNVQIYADADPLVAEDDPRALGDPAAPITMIVYSDFECPFCAAFVHETFEQLRRQYVDTGVVRLVYRDFPIVESHRSALVAAVAGRCAAAQDRFWPMHDHLFITHNEEWGGVPKRDRKVMIEFAGLLELQVDAFERCMADPTIEQAILREAGAARDLGVDATPTFLVNGYFLTGALPFEAFQEAIEQIRSQN